LQKSLSQGQEGRVLARGYARGPAYRPQKARVAADRSAFRSAAPPASIGSSGCAPAA